MASTSRMEPHLWCYACSRLHRQPPRGGQNGAGNGCAGCGSPAALESVVDVVDARVFLDGCHPDARLRRSSQHAVGLLLPPTVTIRDAGRDCAVCLEALEPGASAVVTPCSHMYHPRCIAPWLEARSTCPLCRTHVGAGAGDRDGLVLCHFYGGRLGLGRRVAGRVFHVRLLDADGNLEQPRAPRGFMRRLLLARTSLGAMFRSRRVFGDLEDDFVS